jgi:hypothetical protein
MTSTWMEASVVIGVANIGLTAVLFGLYRRVYAQTRAAFSLGLLFFAGAFVVQNLLVLYSYWATMPLIPPVMSPYLFSIGATEAAGLGAVLWTALH